MLGRRAITLLSLVLLHIGLVLLTLFARTRSGETAILISRPGEAPAVIGLLIIGFLSFVAIHVGFRARTKDGVSLTDFVTRIRQLRLGPALVFSLIAILVLLVGIIRNGGFTLGGAENWKPFLGYGASSDEITIWLVSWFLSSSIAFASTSTDMDVERVDVAPRKLSYVGTKPPSEGREFVILQLAERAARLQQRSGYILIGIIFMLICAAIFIVFAGQITTLDVSGVKLVSLAQADVRTAEEELDRINSEIARKQESRKRAKELATKELATKGEQRVEPTSEEASSDDEITKLKFEAKKEALKKANEVLLRVKEKQFEDDRQKDQASSQLLLIQTSVTRFGVVLIMVFLVQILVSLYRYNMRLSAFYFGRADALVLLNKMPSELRTLVDVISPDKLDFGKPPRTPAEEAGGLLQAWAGRVPRGRSSRGKGGPKKKKNSDTEE